MEELDLKELLSAFWAKKTVIILFVVMFVAIGYVYSFFLVTPKYQSTTAILLAKSNASQDDEDSTITSTDITLNQKLVSTYSELIKTESVLTQVIDNLNLDREIEDLKENITVSAKSDTEIIELKVVDEKPEKAQRIAKEVANVFIEKIAKEYYNMDNVYIVSEPKVEDEAYNINHVRDLLIFAVIGFALAFVYVLLVNMLDTTVKTKEDIEKKLGLTVLTTIPMCDFQNGGKR